MSKHTPGPWVKGNQTWEGDGAGGVLVTTEKGDCIAFCTTWTDRGEPESAQPCDYANAALIASAPDLLEALEEIASYPSLDAQELMRIARKAIARAKGESQ